MMNARVFLFSVFLLVPTVSSAERSALWGSSGERWTPSSRLPDFSNAGYRSGQQAIPHWPVKGNVKDFGAVGDGTTDDTQAFLQAIRETNDGVLLIPQGHYRISQVLRIKKSHFVIRGAGSDRTVLFFPQSLKEIAKHDDKLQPPAGSWSWSGGFLSFEGDNDDTMLGRVTAPAKRGENRLTVSSLGQRRAGDRIRLWQFDKDGSLGQYLYAGQSISPREFAGKKVVDFSARIQFVKGHTIVLERPLRVDVRLEWAPAVYADEPEVEDVGVEELTIEFPVVAYAGHHEEPGYNAIDFSSICNGWVQNVVIHNADSGIFLREGTKFCTIKGVRLTEDPGRFRLGYGSDPGEPQMVKVAGHHGILITGLSQDNLVTDFQIEARMIHELGVENAAAGNVFCAGRGVDLALDHHRRAPYENLFTNIDAGEGTHLWENGGDQEDGLPAGMYETFWNIRTRQPQTLPPWAILINTIGISTQLPGQLSPEGNWLEPILPDQLQPANLYLAQRAVRQGERR
jgi:hypothetical protein